MAKRRGGNAERHPDADLPALRFDDASGEVERGERGAGQDQHREDVVEALVALDVVVQVAVPEVAPGTVEGDADVGEAFGQRRFELGAHDIAIGAGRELQHEVVGGPGTARDALGRVEGCEHRREVGLGEERVALPGDEEVLGREAETDVVEGRPPAHRDPAVIGEVVVIGEVDVQHRDVSARIARAAGCGPSSPTPR